MDGQLELGLGGARLRALSVTQLVRAVRETLELNLDELWVVGEVSNARLAPSGHLYFTLKDAQSAVNAVMFRTACQGMRFRLSDGMEVLVRGRVSVYEARGALQLYAEEVQPRGLGALQLAFEQLKERLEKEGLFDPARKRALPFLPRTVGIVTALSGAALRDMLRILLERFPNLHVIIGPARVQGAGAAEEIARALADLNRDGRAEVIIVGRGGGSLEDLWAFNEEAVARAIHRSRIPVVSAVGHEIDYTIADFVADARAPTPTAAAQMVVPSRAELARRLGETETALGAAVLSVMEERRRRVGELAGRLKEPRSLLGAARQRLDEAAAELSGALEFRLAEARRRLVELKLRLRAPAAMVRERRLLASRLSLKLGRAASAIVEARRRELVRLAERLRAAGPRALEARRAALLALTTRLDSLSPLAVLARGYAVATNLRDGRVVVDAGAVEVGDELALKLSRGRLFARTSRREV